jgi:hypothetical protein
VLPPGAQVVGVGDVADARGEQAAEPCVVLVAGFLQREVGVGEGTPAGPEQVQMVAAPAEQHGDHPAQRTEAVGRGDQYPPPGRRSPAGEPYRELELTLDRPGRAGGEELGQRLHDLRVTGAGEDLDEFRRISPTAGCRPGGVGQVRQGLIRTSPRQGGRSPFHPEPPRVAVQRPGALLPPGKQFTGMRSQVLAAQRLVPRRQDGVAILCDPRTAALRAGRRPSTRDAPEGHPRHGAPAASRGDPARRQLRGSRPDAAHPPGCPDGRPDRSRQPTAAPPPGSGMIARARRDPSTRPARRP